MLLVLVGTLVQTVATHSAEIDITSRLPLQYRAPNFTCRNFEMITGGVHIRCDTNGHIFTEWGVIPYEDMTTQPGLNIVTPPGRPGGQRVQIIPHKMRNEDIAVIMQALEDLKKEDDTIDDASRIRDAMAIMRQQPYVYLREFFIIQRALMLSKDEAAPSVLERLRNEIMRVTGVSP